MANLSPAQRSYIKRRAKPKLPQPGDDGGELNIVPFLDIVMNILMFVLATITTVFTSTISVPAPRSGPPGHAGENSDEINITVKIVNEGFIVAAPGGFLQPGCTSVASAAITVPLAGGFHDYDTLTRCMVAIRNHHEWGPRLADRHNIQVAVNGDISYHILVSTLDALRESRPGANDMFYEPTLGIL